MGLSDGGGFFGTLAYRYNDTVGGEFAAFAPIQAPFTPTGMKRVQVTVTSPLEIPR